MDGLRTDQAPPLGVPTRFYLLAPIALLAAGVLLAAEGPAAFATRWSPAVLALTHLFTLGMLGSILIGSLYQVIPVVAGVPVVGGGPPGERGAEPGQGGPSLTVVGVATSATSATSAANAANAASWHPTFVLVAWALGVPALVTAFLTGAPTLFTLATLLLGGAVVVFLVPVTIALARAPTRTSTVWGIRLAVAALVVVVGFGVHAALVRAGLASSRDYLLLVLRHATLGGLVWVGTLLVSVSWQVVPMFYLAPPLPRWSERPTLAAGAGLLVGALVLPSLGLSAVGPSSVGLAVVAAPAALAMWGVHPWLAARAIHNRRRKRADYSLRFWLAGLAFGAISLVLFVAASVGDEPRWALALGWSASFGWAGLVSHGMLSRIVPFLVWFHRYSPLVGRRPVPSMRELLPEARLQPALVLHTSAAVAGLVAIAAGDGHRVVGVLLAATGAALLVNLVTTLRG